jgi:hypothetical protein
MKKYILRNSWVLILSLCSSIAFGQTVLFYDGFEGGVKPNGWQEEWIVPKIVSGDTSAIPWLYQRGGRLETWPDTAAVGNYNACFIYQSYNNEATRLVMPPINLAGRVKPALTFWHVQQTWSWLGIPANDQLRVVYKRGTDSTWKELASYTTAVENWTFRTVQIPDSVTSSTFYIGFEGKTKYGNGTCIDDIKVQETGIAQRRLSNLKVNQATTDYLASGTQFNPVLRIDFSVTGNEGSVPLQALTVHSACSNDSIIPANGIRLYYTSDTFFNSNTPLGIPKSLVGGDASFTGLNQILPFGLSSIWVTFDVKSSVPKGAFIDAIIKQNTIQVNDTLYPATDQSPPGRRNIVSKIYFTDFETDPGWTLTGDFQRNSPLSLGGYQNNSYTGGNPDPSSAYLGSFELGDDLTGINPAPGNYLANVPANNPNLAITPSIDLLYYKDIDVSFARWLNVYREDSAAIEASIDNGLHWTSIWSNGDEGGIISDGQWMQENLQSTTKYYERHKFVKFRFRLGPTTNTRLSSGWNIDNFLITGNYITQDIGVSSLITPKDACSLTNSEPVKVMIRNYGGQAVTTPFQVSYALGNGKPVITETISTPIAIGDSLAYTFIQHADLSSPDVYASFKAYTSFSGDEDAGNDTLKHVLYSLPYSSLPYFDNFEQPVSFWRTYGNANNTFACGTPGGIYNQLQGAYSGVKAWKNNLTNYYLNNDSSFVESPCFNFTGIDKAIFEFKMWLSTEYRHDGAALQYSINGGTSWQIVPKHPYPWKWNWYGDSIISALGTVGWDSLRGGWMTAKQILPAAISNQPQVKFRFIFRSDSLLTEEGFAFDDVKIYNAPKDIGVSSFSSLVTGCQFTNSNYISLYVKNYGPNSMKSGDTIIVGLDVNTNSTLRDTFKLVSNMAVGDSVKHTFTKATNLDNFGLYNIKAFTLIEQTPRFYGTRNDTASISITVLQNPITNLLDTMHSSRPDTIILRPYFSGSYNYFWYYNSSTASTFHVPAPGKYKLRVNNTGGNGCASYDSTVIIKLIPDIGVDSILTPVTACTYSNNEKPTVRLRNFGTDTLGINDTLYVAVKLGGGATIIDTIKLSQRFFPNAVLNHTINKAGFDLHLPAAYSIKAWSRYRYDNIPLNDTISRTFHVWGNPTVNLGPDTLVHALYYLLNAGPGFKSYLWNNGDTTQTYKASFIGNHWVRVTDSHNCNASDTAHIYLVIHDIAMALVKSPKSACSITGLNPVKVKMSNTGTDTIITGTLINVGYSLNGASWIPGSILLSSNIIPGDSAIYTFTPLEDFTKKGRYILDCYAHIPGDIRPTNDTLRDTVNVWGKPILNLGHDTTLSALNYLLDAGAGVNCGYVWRDGSKKQTYTVTSTGYYFVTKTDTLHGCTSRDTVIVTLIIKDIGINSLVAVNSVIPPDTTQCHNDFKNFTVKIRNNGNVNLNTGTKIPVGYTMNGGSAVWDTAILAAPMSGTTTLNFIIKRFPALPTGTNQIKVFTKLSNDLNRNNDSLEFTLVIYPSPIVNLGPVSDTIESNVFPYNLTGPPGFVSYAWQGGTPSTDSTYIVSGPGWYKVKVTNSYACVTQDSVFVESTVFVKGTKFSDELLSVYPNPSSGMITISLQTQGRSDLVLEMINSGNQLIMSRKINGPDNYLEQFDLSGLAKGMYFLRIYNNEVMHIHKFILQ